MAPEKDTPPASPSFIPEEEANEDEEELDAEGAVEIIDLDELMDAAEGGEEEGEALEPPQEDNSSLTFKEHGSKNTRTQNIQDFFRRAEKLELMLLDGKCSLKSSIIPRKR